MDLINEYKIHWMKKGLYFGYPPCCVQAFMNKGFAQPTDDQALAAQGTGFIPCLEHTRQILAGEIKIADIIEGYREAPPFPWSEM